MISVWVWIAMHLPKSVVYWCLVRAIAEVVDPGVDSPTDIRFVGVLHRYEAYSKVKRP